MTEGTLLTMADDNKTADLVKICREMRELWYEYPDRTTAKGSFRYWTYEKMVYGVNVSGKLAEAPPGQLDVWLRTETLAEVAGIPHDDIKQIFKKQFEPFAAGQMDFVIRLKNKKDAELLITQLRALADSAGRIVQEEERLYLEYWQALIAYLESEGSQFVGKPERQSWLYSDLDETYWIGVMLDVDKQGHIWVGIECGDEDLWERLKLAKDQIHQEVGTPLEWEEPTKQWNAYAGIYLEADPKDRSDWPRQHRLLHEKLKVLYPVFARWVEKPA